MAIIHPEVTKHGSLFIYVLSHEVKISKRGRGTWEKREEYILSWIKTKGREELYIRLGDMDGSIRNVLIRCVIVDCTIPD